MKAKLQKHKLVIALSGFLFLVVFYYYAVVDPVILKYGDDWGYFGTIDSWPTPKLGLWNVTRIFPEYLMPLAGLFSVSFIYPFTGDYQVAASTTLALVMAVSISLLFLAIYNLLSALGKDKGVGVKIAIAAMLLCFAIFKDDSGVKNVHMFYTYEYNLHFFYVLPNILNSLVVLNLMRQIATQGDLRLSTDVEIWQRGWMLVAIYFCIFSMLFSASILLSFAISVLIFRFIQLYRRDGKKIQQLKNFGRDCIKNYSMALIVILGMAVEMCLESTSGRSRATYGDAYHGSLFSGAFLGRIWSSAINLFVLARSMSKYVFVITMLLFLITAIHYISHRESRANLNVYLAGICLSSAVFLSLFYVLISAKAGRALASHIHCVYGVFFFLILATSLSVAYMLQEIQLFQLFMPFALVVLLMVIINTSWPYRSNYLESKESYIRSVLPAIIEADALNHTVVDLYLPNINSTEMRDYTNIVTTLYKHRVIENKIKIEELKLSEDGSIYVLPK